MKHIIIPIITVTVGIIQLIALALFHLLMTLWHWKRIPFYEYVYSEHMVLDDTITGTILGFLDGTHGLMSWLIEYTDIKCMGRVRLFLKTVQADTVEIVSVKTYIVNGIFKRLWR